MPSRVSPPKLRTKHITLLFVIALLVLLALAIVAREVIEPTATAHRLFPARGNPIPSLASPRPTQSSPIALAPNNVTLLNVNPEANTVTVFNVSTDTPAKQAELAVGKDPSSVAILPDGSKAYVANSFDGTVSIINLPGLTVGGSFAVGAEPMAVAVSPNGSRLYVANSASNNLMVFNTATNAPVATIDLSSVGTAPRAIGITNDGDADDTDETIFVALFYAQLRPGKTNIQEGQDDQREGRVAAISSATNTVLGTALLGPIANTGFNSNGQLAPGGPPAGSPANPTPAIPSLNPQAFTTPTGAFPNQLASIAIQPGQSRAYVVSTGASPNGPLRFNQMAQGLVSLFNTSTRAEITAVQTGAGVRQTAPLNLNQGVNLGTTPAPRLFLTNPVAMAWRPDGSDAWIAVQQSDLIVRATVDAGGIPTVNNPLVAGPSTLVRVDLQAVSGGQIPGIAPQGMAVNSAGTRLYSFNFVSHSVTVVNISNPTAPTIAGTGLATSAPFDAAHLGEELFFSGRGPQGRMSSEAWGACVVCHPKGRSDNVTWMFDAGPRQTISLDGTFNKGIPHDQRILNWSGVRDENQDFELNTRQVFGGRGLIDDDRLFLAFGGASGATPTDSALVEQFDQFTGAVSTTNDLTGAVIPPALPPLLDARRDFAIATLSNDRVFIIGGRSGAGDGTLITGANTVLEFNPRTNVLTPKSNTGFTPRHSLGAAAVRTIGGGVRIYAIGGYAAALSTTPPTGLVQEYNPATDSWRTVATLPTATAQFGITVAGGINTAEPLQLIHVVSGNASSEAAPSVIGGGSIVQRFQPDPSGPGTWSAFTVPGLTPRRNHGAATALRGVQSRIFVIGGQDAGGTVLATVEEYAAQAVVAIGPTTPPGAPFFGPHPPRTSLPAPRARFGIGSTLTTNQIYLVGGVDGTGADQTTIFEYTASNNTAAGNPGTPTGAWVNRGAVSVARRGLQVSTPPGVTNLLPWANTGRASNQDAIAAFVATIRSAQAPVLPNDPSAAAGQTLFNTVGLVQPGFSCATCHGGPRWSRSIVDYTQPPSAEVGLGLGNERVIGAELRQTATQNPAFPVLVNVNTFTPNSAGGRVNEIRANPADPSQAIAPLGPNGFNIPSLLSVHETAPYFYSGLAQTLNEVFDGSQDGNGNPVGVRHHFITNATQRAQIVAFLRSIQQVNAPLLSKSFGAAVIGLNSTTSLSFTITNANSTPLTGVGFTDNLPAGLQASNSSVSVCAGTLTTTTGTVSLSGATIAGNGSCQFSVTVTGTTAGVKNNTTGNVTSNEGTGNTASASVTVSSCAAPAITCPSSVTKFTDPGQTTATFNPGTPTTSGGCNPKTVTGTRNDGKPLNSPYPTGVTLITWKVTDASNLSASCVQTVVVMTPSGDRRKPGGEEEETMLGLYLLLTYFTGHF